MTQTIKALLIITAILIYASFPPSSWAQNRNDFLSEKEKEWLREHKTIRLGVGIAFPPFQWVDKKNDTYVFKGVVSDYIKLFEQRLNVNMEVVFGLPFGEALERGKNKEIDVFPCISYSPERAEFLNFTDPYLTYPLVIITREDAPLVSGVEDLNNKKIAVVKPLIIYSTLKTDYPHLNLAFVETKNIGKNLEVVSMGNADACIVNLAAASYFIQIKGLTNLKISAPVNWDQYSLSMGIRNDWPELRTILQKALAGISQEEKDRISLKWIRVRFPAGIHPKRLVRWSAGAGTAVLLLFLFVFIWNRRLKKEVEERIRAEKKIRESENRYRTLFESANDSIYILEVDTFIDCNPKGLEMFGCTMDELIGKTPFDFSPDDQNGFNSREIGNQLLTKVLNGTPCSFEWTHRKNDGTLFFADVSLTLLTIHDKRHILAIARDISERKTMLEEKKHLEHQLRQSHKMEAIGTLAGGIAHDFNNILSIIIGNTDLAMDDIQKWHPARYNLDEIKTAGFRAKDVVRQLLSYSRKTEQHKVPVDLNGIVKESIKLLRSTLPATLEIHTQFRNDVATVMADPTQIHQILLNLCTNAAHAMEDGGGELEIRVDTITTEINRSDTHIDLEMQEYVRLVVKDNGHGIEPDIQSRIFDPYFTTKDTGKGSGMGLAVVHGIITDHDGKISLSSEPGKGCTVTVLLPALDKSHETEPLKSDEQGIHEGTETILLVDDEISLLNMGAKTLERLGYTIHKESDPIQALKIFTTAPDAIDLVITDMTMPKMTGDILAMKLLEIRPGLPIILMTGFSEKIDKLKAEAIGIHSYAEKPLSKERFSTLIHDALKTKKDD